MINVVLDDGSLEVSLNLCVNHKVLHECIPALVINFDGDLILNESSPHAGVHPSGICAGLYIGNPRSPIRE